MIQIIAVISLVLGVPITLFNWYSIYASYRSGRNVSPAPILGGILLFLGLFGFPETRAYAWVGIVSDYGTISLIAAFPAMIWEAWSTCSVNLAHRFVSDLAGRHDDIRLFKQGKFTIRSEHKPSVVCNKYGALAKTLGFVGTWREESPGFVLEGYRENRVLQILESNGHFATREQNYPVNREFPVDQLDSLKLIKLR